MDFGGQYICPHTLLYCLHLHLYFQLRVISHENKEAVEGSQAMRVGPAAGTPWAKVKSKKIAFRT